MKKEYVTWQLNVTAFDADDVVTASITYLTEFFGAGVDAKDTWWND